MTIEDEAYTRAEPFIRKFMQTRSDELLCLTDDSEGNPIVRETSKEEVVEILLKANPSVDLSRLESPPKPNHVFVLLSRPGCIVQVREIPLFDATQN